MWSRFSAGVARLVAESVSLETDEQARLRTVTAALIAVVVVLLSPLWIVTYSVLGRPLSAAIPGAYVAVSVCCLAWLAWRKRSRAFAGIQIALYAVLPVALQASLGGFQNGSAVALWSFSAPMLALVVYGIPAGLRWFGVFAASITVLGLTDGILRGAVTPLPVPAQVVFFVLNVVAPATTVIILLLYFIRQRDAANARTESLLLQILPSSIVARLKRGESQIADGYGDATVLFADFVGFTEFADRTAPERLVALLGRAFEELDALAAAHGLEKIKTLGDGYLAVAGVTRPVADHAVAAASMALEIQPALARRLGNDWPGLSVRVGIASGPLVAGVIGRDRLGFDVWGDTVNTASRLADIATPGGIQVSQSTRDLIQDRYSYERQEDVYLKGKGRTTSYALVRTGPSALTLPLPEL